MDTVNTSSYEIRVNISIIENGDTQKSSQGYVSLIINEEEAENIDKIEKSVLKTSFPAIRKAVSNHLTLISKKKAMQKMIKGDCLMVNNNTYRIDGEIGRFTFKTHSLYRLNKEIYNTSKHYFPSLKGKEYYKTIGFKEIAIVEGVTQSSYRKTEKLLNKIRYQTKEEGTPVRSLQNTTESEGSKINEWIEKKTEDILSNEFNNSETVLKQNLYSNEIMLQSKEKIEKAILECQKELESKGIISQGKLNDNKVPYEDPKYTVNICDDEVKVKKQKEKRSFEEKNEKSKKKYILDTLIHVEKSGIKYVLTGIGIKNVLRILIAFLLNSKLLGNRFQFFTDGHTVLNNSIIACFSWYWNIGIILDWYHLSKKCKERLSMGIKGRKIRNEILKVIMPLLWNGLVEDAIEYLYNIGNDKIKDISHVEKLIDYLKRNEQYIPCYSVRKKLGLRNSSNIGEKMNDLVISERQKHHGMSWSKNGSISMAGLKALIINNESDRWFADGYLEFKLAA